MSLSPGTWLDPYEGTTQTTWGEMYRATDMKQKVGCAEALYSQLLSGCVVGLPEKCPPGGIDF
jgi:hypothetical protein